ncbi:MAG TPA: hypothetical protein PK855_10445, partial [Bacteroidales bacterium]|nr:hypothetical protein [Bacteroidales bacterium]
PMPYELLENFETWIRKQLKRQASVSLTDIVVCGQSVINDINFLDQMYADQNLEWPFSYRLVDLMSLSVVFYQIFDANKMPRPKSYSLNAVSAFFGLQREDVTHNALEDAKLTYQCFKKYFELIPKLKLQP